MDRLHCSYQELLRTPEHVIEDVTMIIEAEAKAADAKVAQIRMTYGRDC